MYLTVHNVYPHLLNVNQKANYRKRFDVLKNFLSGYLVHLESSKHELAREFGIDDKKITVAYHGIYVPNEMPKNGKKADDGVVRLIMYGYQTPYKGADILVEAIDMLPEIYKEKVRCTIMGKTDPQIFEKSQKKAEKNQIEWIDRFVSDEELYNAIGLSDLILLPYRSISQSGVLLLALSYNKPILTSDLPSFRETMDGYPDNYFFEAENAQSLANKLVEFVDGKIDKELMIKVIKELNHKYSWDETAKRTLEAYGFSIG
jgi:glycosyltransferase involved in cell wall biosynthesis